MSMQTDRRTDSKRVSSDRGRGGHTSGGPSGVGDAAEEYRGAGDHRAVFGAEGLDPLIEPGVALCPGGAGELVAPATAFYT
jgi:hypothetical protein